MTSSEAAVRAREIPGSDEDLLLEATGGKGGGRASCLLGNTGGEGRGEDWSETVTSRTYLSELSSRSRTSRLV